MLAFQQGDQSAFDVLYRRHCDRLYRFLVREAGSKEAGEEVYQEVWLRIIRAKASYTASSTFSSYLYTVAHNCLMDHFRRHSGVRLHEALEAADGLAACPLSEPARQGELHDYARHLEVCLASLPDIQREVFLLKAEQGFSLPEIAVVMEAEFETVKSRLRYALKKLRECLGAAGVTEGAHG